MSSHIIIKKLVKLANKLKLSIVKIEFVPNGEAGEKIIIELIV